MGRPFVTPLRRSRAELPLGMLALCAGLAAGSLVFLGGRQAALALAVAVWLPMLAGFRVPRLLAAAGWAMLLPTGLTLGVALQPALIAAYLASIVLLVLQADRRSFDPWLVWSACAFIGLLGLSAWQALRQGDATLSPLVGFGTVAVQMLFIVAGSNRASPDEGIEEFVALLAVPSLALAAWSIGESVLGRGLVYPLAGARSVGPLGNPNYLGGLLALLTILQLSLVAVRKADGRRLALPLVSAAICLGGTIATLSRGALLGVAAGAVVIAFRSLHRGRSALIVALVATLAWAVGPVAYGAITHERASTSSVAQLLGIQAAYRADRYATRVREQAAGLAIAYAVDQPLTGIGLDRFAAQASRDPTFLIEINTHNEPLRIAAEVGLVAFGLLVAFVVIVVRTIRRRGSAAAALALPAMVCYGVVSLFLNGLEYLTITYPVVAVAFLAVGRPGTMAPASTPRTAPPP